MRALDLALGRAARLIKDLAGLSPSATAYVYDIINRQAFSDLTWHERMLADRARVEAYREGIQAAVKAGDVVIDLGTGTGILAFLAARSGAKRVYAIDHSDFIEVAREIGARNGFDNVVFVPRNSRDFVAPEPADVIVHEQLGPALFGENIVLNLLDLKRRTLKSSGRIAPGRFDLFIEPASLKEEYRVPLIWEMDHLDLDLAFLGEDPGLRKYRGRSHGVRQVKGFEIDVLLCEPTPILSFDLNEISGEDAIPRRFRIRRSVLREGELDGFCTYFQGRFENGTSFGNSPCGRQTNWDNVLIRTPRRHVEAGSQLIYSVALEDLEKPRTWKVEVSAAR